MFHLRIRTHAQHINVTNTCSVLFRNSSSLGKQVPVTDATK